MPNATFRRRTRNDRAARRREARKGLRVFDRGRAPMKFAAGRCHVDLAGGHRRQLAWSADEAASRFANIGPTDIWMVPLVNGKSGYLMAHHVVGFIPTS